MKPLIHRLAFLPCTVLLLTVWAGEAFGQEPAMDSNSGNGLLVENWQTDRGLPRNTVNSLVQDDQGYLWMGTLYGLARYDGVRFLELGGEGLPAFVGQGGRRLFCDRAGDIWFAPGRSGPYRIRAGVAAPVLAAGQWGDVPIDSIHQDAQGVIWIVDGNGRLGYVEGDQFRVTAKLGAIATGPMLFSLCSDASGNLWFYKQNVYGQIINGQPTNYAKLSDAVIRMAGSRDGGMWLSTGKSLGRIAPGASTVTSNVCSLPFGPYGISAMQEDRTGVLWLGTLRDGAYRVEHGHLKKVPVVHHHVTDFLEDAEGCVWVATDGAGLFKVRPRVFHIQDESVGLLRANVASVSGDWAAPVGGGLARRTTSGRLEMLPEHASNSIVAVLDDGAGGAWLGTAANRLIRRTSDGVVSSSWVGASATQLRVLHLDRTGNLWIGGYPFGLFLMPAGQNWGLKDLTTNLVAKVSINAIAEDGQGRIWIGTGNGGLLCYDHGAFSSLGMEDRISSFPIGALLADKADNLWVGTLGGGLGCLRNGELEFFGERLGLDDNVISQLIADDLGSLWVGSSRGIARVRMGDLIALAEHRKDEVSASHYGRSDGLVNVQCTVGSQPSVWKTEKGGLLFATSLGIVSFDPVQLAVNLRPPPLILESVLVDGLPITNQAAVKLRHDFKKLEFRYNATSFVAPEKMMFKHRLIGFDEDWIFDEDNTRRAASYPRLPPGNYVFQFTACNNDGVWNDEIFSRHFAVVPAFWQTAWFRVVMIVLFAGAVGGTVFIAARIRMRRKLARLEQANALDRERMRISRDLHDDLGARLTQMALLTDMAADDPGASTDLKGQIKDVSTQARHAVQSLDETVWMINPQKDTLAHVIGYVARYAEQFFQPTNITCLQEVCSHPPDCIMSGTLRRDILLLVKESLNNVLKHSQASEVRLRINVRADVMRITVRDNGRGFVGSPNAQRYGMDSMLRRAENAGIKVTLRSQAGHGTLVALRVKLPLTGKRPVHKIHGGLNGICLTLI